MELFDKPMEAGEIKALPTLTLAHMGDCVYELMARSFVVRSGAFKAYETHLRTVAMVSAEAQFLAAEEIMPLLEQDELTVFTRGRNAKPKSIPKHATLQQYAYATGLEALFGYLYLSGQHARIAELWEVAVRTAHGGEDDKA